MIILNLLSQLSAISLEIFMLTMILFVMMADLFAPSRSSLSAAYVLTQVTLIGTFLLLWIIGFRDPSQLPLASTAGSFLNGQFVADRLSFLLGMFICLTGFLSFWYGRVYHQLHRIPDGEFYALGLLSMLGGLVLVSSGSLLTLYLGLELLSLPLYAVIALRRDSLHSIEAAMKYFVMGAIASAFLLYGFSLIYGLTGTFELKTIAHEMLNSPGLFSLGILFVMVAVGFKLGVVPFHGWVADVYQGSPTSVTIFLGSVPKLAALGLFFRLFAETFSASSLVWTQTLMVLAVLSIFVGNVTAIAQTNLKRLLGYSTIAHMGFLFLALSLGSVDGNRAAFFYLVTYVLTTVAAFGLILFMSRLGVDAEILEDFKGLNKNHPWLSFMMLLVLLSMAGIPPLVGFDAKLFILKALLDGHHLGLLIYALLMSVVAAGYYLRVIKVMYFDESGLNAHFNERNRSKLSVFNFTGVVLSANCLLLLAIGMFPNGLYQLI